MSERKIDLKRLEKMWFAGDRVVDIAATFKCTPAAVSIAATSAGLPTRYIPRSRIPLETVLRMRQRGDTLATIAKHFKCSIQAISRAEARARRLAKPAEVSPALKNEPPEPPNVPGAPFWDADKDRAVLETKGSWAAISDLAKAWGWPTRRVEQRWHGLRA